MSTTIERVRLFAAVVLVAIGGVLSTAALAGEGDDHEATKRCQGQCSLAPRPNCAPIKWCCCKVPESPGKWRCICLLPLDCYHQKQAGNCQF